jgi:hypothetical protein
LNLTFYCHVHSLLLALSWARWIQSNPHSLMSDTFCIILASTSRSSKWSHFFGFHYDNPLCLFINIIAYTICRKVRNTACLLPSSFLTVVIHVDNFMIIKGESVSLHGQICCRFTSMFFKHYHNGFIYFSNSCYDTCYVLILLSRHRSAHSSLCCIWFYEFKWEIVVAWTILENRLFYSKVVETQRDDLISTLIS